MGYNDDFSYKCSLGRGLSVTPNPNRNLNTNP